MKISKNPLIDVLNDLAEKDSKVVVLDADTSTSSKTNKFAKHYPNRFINMGISEQNMIGVASGLSLAGMTPFAVSIAAFLTRKTIDQIALSVCYPSLNVKLIGMSSAFSSARDGATHQSLDDIALMRTMPNMRIFTPSSANEVRQTVYQAYEDPGPCYIRLQRNHTSDSEQLCEFKDYALLREGSDLTIIAAGAIRQTAIEAAEALSNEANIRVIGLLQLKPINEKVIIQAAQDTGLIVTLEEHSIIGGLGSAVSEVVTEHCPVFVERIGIKDCFGQSALEREHLLEYYDLSLDYVVSRIREALKKRRQDD